MKNKKGFTLVELVLVMGMIGLLIGGGLMLSNPNKKKQEARDAQRLANISAIDGAINEYKLDKGRFPDNEGAVRKSSTPTAGDTDTISKSSFGWISADFSKYLPALPVDPLNDATYFYTYKCTGGSYELNATLEIPGDESRLDEGDNQYVYEVGNDLMLIQ